MEQQQYLIDTNVVIDYLGERLPVNGMDFMNNIIDAGPNISVVTKIEVLGFNAAKDHEQLLQEFISDSNITELTSHIVDKSIELRKIYKIKLPDTIIAASALVNSQILITRNVSDFEKITGLSVVNPWDI